MGSKSIELLALFFYFICYSYHFKDWI